MEPGNTRPEDLPLSPSTSSSAFQETRDDATRSEPALLKDTESTSLGGGDLDTTLPATTQRRCYSPIQGYFDGFTKFENNINATLQKLPRVQVKYDRVLALVVYWDKSDVSGLSENAEKLKTMFDDDYGFEVDSYVLENGNHKSNIPAHNKELRRKFLNKLLETTASIDENGSTTDDKEVNNLLILYYGGHGADLKTSGKPEKVWQPTRQSKTMLKWHELQQEVREIDCDVLFIFDCYYALAMIDAEKPWNRRCEILGASGASDKASARPESSFTQAIVEELEKPKRKNAKGMDVLWFHTLMTSTEMTTAYNLSPSPQWKRYSGDLYQTSISLESKKITAKEDMTNQTGTNPTISNTKAITNSIDELSSLSDIRMLIQVRFFNAAETLLEEEWMKWFRLRPSNIASGGIEIAILSKAILQKIRSEGAF
jgi:hypothetical protein